MNPIHLFLLPSRSFFFFKASSPIFLLFFYFLWPNPFSLAVLFLSRAKAQDELCAAAVPCVDATPNMPHTMPSPPLDLPPATLCSRFPLVTRSAAASCLAACAALQQRPCPARDAQPGLRRSSAGLNSVGSNNLNRVQICFARRRHLIDTLV